MLPVIDDRCCNDCIEPQASHQPQQADRQCLPALNAIQFIYSTQALDLKQRSDQGNDAHR